MRSRWQLLMKCTIALRQAQGERTNHPFVVSLSNHERQARRFALFFSFLDSRTTG